MKDLGFKRVYCAVSIISMAMHLTSANLLGQNSPSEIYRASWEKVIVMPDLYAGRVIRLDGWLQLREEDERLEIVLFKDREAMDYDRDRASILLNVSAVLDEAKRANIDLKASFDGKFVSVCSVFKPYSDWAGEQHVGVFVGSFILEVEVNSSASAGGAVLRSSKW